MSSSTCTATHPGDRRSLWASLISWDALRLRLPSELPSWCGPARREDRRCSASVPIGRKLFPQSTPDPQYCPLSNGLGAPQEFPLPTRPMSVLLAAKAPVLPSKTCTEISRRSVIVSGNCGLLLVVVAVENNPPGSALPYVMRRICGLSGLLS